MKPLKPLLLAIPLAVLAIAGCGGGGDDTTEATARETAETAGLSQEELISEGDAICAETNAAIGSVGSSAADTPTQITQTANLYIGMVEGIQDLGTPDDPAGYSDFIEAAEELAKIEGELKLAAEREDTGALGELATEAAPIIEEFQAEAAIYGFEDCSEGPTATVTGPGSGVGGEEVEEGGVEAEIEEEVLPEEEVAPEEEEIAPETGGAGGGVEETPAPEESGGSESGGVGPG